MLSVDFCSYNQLLAAYDMSQFTSFAYSWTCPVGTWHWWEWSLWWCWWL